MAMTHALRAAAFGTWLVCGLPVAAASLRGGSWERVHTAWAAAFVLFGLSLTLALSQRERAPRAAAFWLAVQSAAAIAVNGLARPALDASGASAGLFVVVAAQLPYLGSRPAAACVLVLQALAGGAVAARSGGAADGIGFGVALLGFQLFAFLTTELMRREASGRRSLAEANAELLATRALLAEASRQAERLRIARELHDSVGHHLTALSLELEVAGRRPSGGHLQRAQAIARALLGDVRAVVSEMRDVQEPDLAAALRTLVARLPTGPLRVQLDLPEPLAIDDAGRAHVLLRCVQELLTNTVRHARASQLWIRIEQEERGLRLHARDNGRGAACLRIGNGLGGMRERLALHAGTVEFTTAAGRGFEARVFMPRGQVPA